MRLLIEHVSLVLLDLFESLLGIGLLLLADLAFDNLLTVKSLFPVNFPLVIDNFLFGNVHLLVLLVKCHVVEGLLKALNVDLQALQYLLLRCTNAVKFLMQSDSLFFKELFERRFGDRGVVGEAVLRDAAGHIGGVVVSAEHLLLTQRVLDPLE